MPALLRAPLPRFLLAGLLLFALQSARGGNGAFETTPEAQRIEISRTRLDELAARFQGQTGRPPRAEELDRILAAEADEEILFREALARGLLEADPSIKSRLLQKMLFLEPDAPRNQAPALVERAIALDFHREDLVVRRILIQKMRMLGGRLGADERTSQEAIAAAYRARADRLRTPERRTLTQVFLGRDRRGEALDQDARALDARLAKNPASREEAVAFGDPFPLGHSLVGRTQRDLERDFGAGFGEASFAAPPGRWTGPIASAYGLHFVRVESIQTGRVPPLESVQNRLRLELDETRRAAKLEALLTELRSRYRIVVETNEAEVKATPQTMNAQETG